jgi:uncharacterized surface protein with fasciclin (FAS1) repeats
MKTTIPRKFVTSIVVAATLFSACGDGESAVEETVTPSSLSSTETTTGSDESGLGSLAGDLGGTITTILEESSLYSTMFAALTAVELDKLLDAEGPYTLFTPANKAFNDLPEGVLDKLLLPENRETLLKILEYHILEGDYRIENLSSGSFDSLEGSPVDIEVTESINFNEVLKVNGKFVIIPNLRLTNGTIHVINWIMLPPGIDLDSL